MYTLKYIERGSHFVFVVDTTTCTKWCGNETGFQNAHVNLCFTIRSNHCHCRHGGLSIPVLCLAHTILSPKGGWMSVKGSYEILGVEHRAFLVCMTWFYTVYMLQTDLKPGPFQSRSTALKWARPFWNPQANDNGFKAVHGLPCSLTERIWAALKCLSVEACCAFGRWQHELDRFISVRPSKLVVALPMTSLLIVVLLWWRPCSLSRIPKINTPNSIQNSTQLNSLIAILHNYYNATNTCLTYTEKVYRKFTVYSSDGFETVRTTLKRSRQL